MRVRRAAMGLVATIAVPRGSPGERDLLQAVAHRCRDRDGAVREQAWGLLVQFPSQALFDILQVGGGASTSNYFFARHASIGFLRKYTH